jgi:hypothetical protein
MKLFNIFKEIRRSTKEGAKPVPQQTIIEEESRPATQETSAEEDLIGSIKQFRTEQHLIREKFSSRNDVETSVFIKKIKNAEEFILESGLDESFLNVLKHIWHWASWSQRDDFKQWAAFVPANIIGQKGSVSGWNLSFDFADHRFKFSFQQHDSYDYEYRFAGVSLDFDGLRVLEMGCSAYVNRDYSDWEYSSVKGLVIGDWVQSIVEMDELIKLYSLKWRKELDDSNLREQAENLP